MNTRFCSFCGFKHLWSIEKPKICAKCTKDMDAAFAAVTPPPPSHLPPYREEPEPRRSQRRFYDSRGNDISDRFVRPEPARRPQYSEGEDDYVDTYTKNQMARELAASISADDFGLSVDAEASDKTVKLGSIIQQAMANQPAPAKKRSRKK